MKLTLPDSAEELEKILFGERFGAITYLQVEPYDGNLYVVSVRSQRKNIQNRSTINKYLVCWLLV